MNREDTEDTTIYTVVMDVEERYSIWPEYRAIPPGWQAVGKTGLKADCLDYIKEVWTDMRPLSLRRQMAVAQDTPQQPSPVSDQTTQPLQ
ncbi:MAG: MbtH family NRPS accessory protein [Synechococcales cyanobacterium M58_A2018_015]|nr:MbtH family NRPS accessory protein [Synechococcales cyanobacterium M58_A2018_015]